MSQIIEELKNEDGQYKVRKLSDNKIQLEYKVPIFASDDNTYMKIIETVTIKVRYRIKLDERRSSNELPTYYLIPFKDRFIQIMSQNWKIKKKFIHLQKQNGLQVIENHLIYGLYSGFIFADKDWSKAYQRDTLIKKILKNETGDN
jgi:hypothetical protein